MASKSATVKVDENGRCTIPVEVREALETNGEEWIADIEVDVA